jgi:hypothetical protein
VIPLGKYERGSVPITGEEVIFPGTLTRRRDTYGRLTLEFDHTSNVYAVAEMHDDFVRLYVTAGDGDHHSRLSTIMEQQLPPTRDISQLLVPVRVMRERQSSAFTRARPEHHQIVTVVQFLDKWGAHLVYVATSEVNRHYNGTVLMTGETRRRFNELLAVYDTLSGYTSNGPTADPALPRILPSVSNFADSGLLTDKEVETVTSSKISDFQKYYYDMPAEPGARIHVTARYALPHVDAYFA